MDLEWIIAFNAGCDARIAGWPIEDCPYANRVGANMWRFGWRDVDRHWGREANWPVRDIGMTETAA